MRQARAASIAGQSAQPTAPSKRRGLPCAGFAVTDIKREQQQTRVFRFAPTADLVLSWIDRVSAKTVKAPATG
jgi:hypothetical protein